MPIIALCGMDGCGKSTASRLLYDYLSIHRKLPTELYFMPGGTNLGQELRRIVKSKAFATTAITERLIFAADTAQFIEEKLKPAMKSGKFIICDRFSPITDLLYGAASGLDLDFLDNLQRAAKTNFVCDMFIAFRCPFEIAMRRKIKRSDGGQQEECRIELKGNEFFAKVAKLYNELGSPEGDSTPLGRSLHSLAKQRTAYLRWVDASHSPQEILEQVKKHLDDTNMLPPF